MTVHKAVHKLDPDPDLPADWFGRESCLTCKRMGKAEDTHHSETPPTQQVPPALPPQMAAAARARDAAILGERT